MKNLLSALFLLVIATSCGTYSNGKLHLQRAESNNTTTAEKIQKATNRAAENEITTVSETESQPEVESTLVAEVSTQNETVSNPEQEVITKSSSKTSRPLISLSKTTKKDEVAPEVNTRFATAANLFGGLSFIPVVGWVFSILAIIFGLVALVKMTKYPDQYGGRKRAITGIILGAVSLILGIALVTTLFILYY
ncbi:MAG: DUF4190 domain-containing protein [Crocinitomicaceae bacterium]